MAAHFGLGEKEHPVSSWLPTFGFAADDSEDPAYARHDVRDEVCLRVGGFRHGEVVLDSEDRELVVIGVRSDGEERLFCQPAGRHRAVVAKSLRATGRTRHLKAVTVCDFDVAQDATVMILVGRWPLVCCMITRTLTENA